MCGILGSISENNSHVRFKQALQLINHRGPDDSNIIKISNESINCFLGANRLSFNDFITGAQPFQSSDKKYALIFNGEIYNYRYLKKILMQEGFKFKGNSDTEVALYSLIHWGKKALELWNGMWSFGFLDLYKRQLILSTDPFGQKPLYYSFSKQQFLFSSEMTPILSLIQTKPSKNYLALSQFLTFDYIPAPLTSYKGIFKLEHGSTISLKIDNFTKIKKEKYFSTYNLSQQTNICLEKLDQELSLSINGCIHPTLPAVFSVSGGIDSSTILANAIKNNNIKHPKCFFTSFEDSSFDESNKIKTLRNNFNINLIRSLFTQKKIPDLFNEIYKQLDVPLGDSSMLSSYFLSKDISNHSKYVISGDGGDELFYGYDTFKAISLKKISDFIPLNRQFLKLILNFSNFNHSSMSFAFKLSRFQRAFAQPTDMWLPMWMSNVDKNFCNDIFGIKINQTDIYEPFLKASELCYKKNSSEIMRQQFLNIYLPDNILVVRDRSSMLNSVESRLPLLNLNFAKIALELPLQNDISLFFNQKKHLKALSKNYLPKSILKYKKKGFGSPISKFLFEKSHSNFSKEFSIKNNHFKTLLANHQDKTANHKSALWNLLILNKMSLL